MSLARNSFRAVLRNSQFRFQHTHAADPQVPANPAAPTNQPQHVEKRDISLVGHSMGYFFNTHVAVKNLQKYGYTYEQAEAVTELLTQIVLAQSDTHFKNFVSKSQLEISVQQLLAQIDNVKKDMGILEKSQFAQLRHDLEKMSMSLQQMDTKLLDESSKLKSSMALDMNLEKSRIKDEDYKLHNEIQSLVNQMAVQNANLKSEMANVRVNMEKIRNDMYKYIIAFPLSLLGGISAICFLVYRMMT